MELHNYENKLDRRRDPIPHIKNYMNKFAKACTTFQYAIGLARNN